MVEACLTCRCGTEKAKGGFSETYFSWYTREKIESKFAHIDSVSTVGEKVGS